MRRWLPVVLLIATACSSKKSDSKQTPGSGSTAAPGSGSAPAAAVELVTEWNVVAVAGQCSANELAPCPPNEACDPPPPRAIECPAGATDGNVRVVELADHTCAVAPADCKASACLGAKTPCPLAKGESFPPLGWAVTAMGDGTCVASSSTPGAPPRSITIHCPFPDVAAFTIKRPKADAPCTADANGKSSPIPCPADPKQLAIAQLREALAKDANAFADQRVRVQGFYVKSMIGQVSSGKVTTYMIGASDTKGDAKNAIKCTSTVVLPEAADGEPVVVEGQPKKGTSNELSLVECRASAP